MFKGLDAQRLVALFVAGWLLLSFPLITVWDTDRRLGGLPVFPLALFAIWLLLILALAWVMERGEGDDGTG